MRGEPGEKKRISPLVPVAVLAVIGVALGVWWMDRDPAPVPAPAAPPSLARLGAPVSRAIESVAPAAPTSRLPPRLRAATMSLPASPLIGPRPPAEPLTQSRGGQVNRVGRLLRLDVGLEALGGAKTICLDAPESAEALGGVQATCNPLDGWPAARVICGRNDAAKAIELVGPISWRLPCP